MSNIIIRGYDWVSNKITSLKHPILTIILIGIIIRAIFSISTFLYDVNYWALVMRNIETGEGLYGVAGYYYTPVWGYLLGALSAFSDLFLPIGEMAVKMAEFSSTEIQNVPFIYSTSMVPTLAFAYSIKIPLMICDIIFAYLVYVLAKEYNANERNALMAFILAFLAPTILRTSCIVAMPDTIGATLTVLTIILLKRNQNFLAGISFSLAILTKFFPLFLFLPLVAYIIAKNRESRNETIKQMSLATCGFILATLIIFLPQLMDGGLAECFRFITDRAGGGSTGETWIIDLFSKWTRILIFVLVAIASAYLAYRMIKGKDENADETLIRNCFIITVLCMAFPPTAQYVCILIPFLAFWIAVKEKKYIICWFVIAIGTLLLDMMFDPMQLAPWATAGIIDIDVLRELFDVYSNYWNSISFMSVQHALGNIILYAGILVTIWMMYGEQLMEFIRKRRNANTSGE